MRKTNITLFCMLLFCMPLFSQVMQNDCSDTIRIYTDSIKILSDSIRTLNDTVKTYKSQYQIAEKQFEDYKKKYEQLKSSEKQIKIKEIEKRSDTLSQQLRDTIKAKSELEQTYSKQLKQKQEELDKLQNFKKKWIAQLISEQNTILKKSFADLNQEELNKMREQCNEVKNEKGLAEHINQIDATKQNLAIYVRANNIVNNKYNTDSITNALQSIGTMKLLQLSQAQQEDMKKLSNQLNNYAANIKRFKSIISYFNKQLKVSRELEDISSCKERLSELYKDASEYEQKIIQIPYLSKLFAQYKTDLSNNPLVSSSVEAEINNTEIEK